MSRVQRVQGDLTLDPSGSINLNSNTTVNGDLTVIGTTTTVSSTDTSVSDRVITLNDGESGAGITGRYSGLEFDRGSLDNAFLVFDENDDSLKFSTNNGSTYVGLLTGTGAGLTAVLDDTTPQLGGNLDVNGQSIVTVSNGDITLAPDGTGRVVVSSAAATVEEELKLDQYLRLVDQGGAPTQIASSTLLYAATAGGGGTGLFFVDSSTSDELVSKSKAIVYGLIF